MLVIVLFLLAAVIAAALLIFCAGAAWWQGLLLGLGVFVLLHPLYLLVIYASSLTVDRNKPIERQIPLCRQGTADVLGLLCVYCGIRPHIRGLEKLPEDGRFFLVCNHRSFFDPCLTIDRLRRWNVSFISKPSNLQLPLIGPIGHAAGYLSIDRENNREALKTILQAADYLKRGVCSMAVYPEGTRTKDGNMLPFHAGCFKVAQRAGVPLVVAAIRGTEQVMKNFPFKKTDVYLDILEVIDAERVKAMSTNELSDYSRALMESHLSETA